MGGRSGMSLRNQGCLKSQGFPGLAHEPQVTSRGGEWQVGETLRGWQKRHAGGQVEWQLGWWDPRCSCPLSPPALILDHLGGGLGLGLCSVTFACPQRQPPANEPHVE